MVLNILYDFDVLWTIKERRDSSTVETIHVSRVHKNVTKQTNPLKGDNLITNKYVTSLEASRTTVNTQCFKISVLEKENIF
jgi:hypothetical protein